MACDKQKQTFNAFQLGNYCVQKWKPNFNFTFRADDEFFDQRLQNDLSCLLAERILISLFRTMLLSKLAFTNNLLWTEVKWEKKISLSSRAASCRGLKWDNG